MQRRGALFDLASFLANILLVYPLADLVKQTQGEDPVFALLLLAAAGLHTAGAHLKRRALHARLSAPQSPAMGGYGYLLFMTLAIMHYAVFATGMTVAIAGLGLQGMLGNAEPFIVLGGALLPTGMAVFALIPPRAKEDLTPSLRRRDSTGNLLIYFSILIILAWWDGFWIESLVTARQTNLLLSVLLVVLTTVPFAMFYLAPRMVLLREDYMRRQTWINAAIVMLPLAARLIFR